MYSIISFVGLDVASIINNYVYNPNTQKPYPFGDKKFGLVFTTDVNADYEGLDQAFWTIVDQYDKQTQKHLRYEDATTNTSCSFINIKLHVLERMNLLVFKYVQCE